MSSRDDPSVPPTRYALSGGISIAYQVFGNGPRDLVLIPGAVSHLEHFWTHPNAGRLYGPLASFARVIVLDKRGTGMSDRDAGLPSLEERMDDVRAVMDAVGSERAAIFGMSEGGAMAITFAASHPARTDALILYGTFPRLLEAPGWPGVPRDDWDRSIEAEVERFGLGPDLAQWAPSAPAADQGWWGALHRLVELDGADHLPVYGNVEQLVGEVEEFLTGVRSERPVDRVLATVVFTDIVGSTERAAELGDAEWRRVLDRHDEVARRRAAEHRGRVVKSTGDGVLATFDGPARATRFAADMIEDLRADGLEIRTGVHTGEVELRGDDVGGMAVHVAARIQSHATPGEVLASRTVKDLTVGSGLTFTSTGVHELKGVPDPWELFAVSG